MFTNRDKEVVAILSYANDEKKLDILEECIDVTKSNGFKIILSSAIEVPKDISDKVDYIIIDKENPIITGDELESIGGAIFYNISYPGFSNSYCIDMNHSYAVLKLMKNASSIADINGFDSIHFVNYDYIITDQSVFHKHSELLKEFDLIYYYYVQNINFMNTGFFSVKTNVMIDCFKGVNSKKEFCDKNIPILEEYILKVMKDRNLNIKDELIQQLFENNKIDLISTSDYLVPKKINDQTYNFFLFLSQDTNTKKHYIITLSNLETTIIIKIGDKSEKLVINQNPRVFRIKESMLDDGIKIEVPDFQHSEVLDRNKKKSVCAITDINITEDIESLFDLKRGFYELCRKNGTDKVLYHGYHYFYPNFIEKFRDDTFKLLEIGYGDGKSVKMWTEYFENADITVADINYENEYSDRCRVVKCDQSKKDNLDNLVKQIGSVKIILDDGSHNPIHQAKTFEYLFKNLLEDGGVYIIEDIELTYWNPESVLYGYKTGNFNLIEHFKKYQDMINSEYTNVTNDLDISTITFAQNSIIITKRTQEEKNYFNRTYRFQNCITGICNYV